MTRVDSTAAQRASVGDVLTRLKLPFVHMGIYLGDRQVLHNTPERGEHISDISEFSRGQHLSVQNTLRHLIPGFRQRAMETLVRPRKYDALSNNCEHTVTRVIEGKSYSAQLWIFLVLIAGTAIILAARR